jgi:hypothetical protein
LTANDVTKSNTRETVLVRVGSGSTKGEESMVFSVNAYFAHLAKQFRKQFDTTLSHTQIMTILAQGIGFESLSDFQKAELNDHSYSSIGQALADYRGVFVEDGGYFFTNLGIDDDAWFTFLSAARRDKYAYVDAYLCDYLGGAWAVNPGDPEWEQWASQYPDQVIAALKKDYIKSLQDAHFQKRKGAGATLLELLDKKPQSTVLAPAKSGRGVGEVVPTLLPPDGNPDTIYFDTINGEAVPLTWGDIVSLVSENPYATDPEEPFFFTADRQTSYSVKEVATRIGVDLEEMD